MPLHINADMTALMEHFYILTGLRMVLFDENEQELLAYPAERTPFCAHMRQSEEFDAHCRACDRRSFSHCRKTQTLTVYRCHAGLIEACAPLTSEGRTIGYVMFGQITDVQDREALRASLQALATAYGTAAVSEDTVRRIKRKSEQQILAASKILEACANYILLKDMIRPSGKALFDRINTFIRAHLHEPLSVERLCSEFHISRTNLYNAMHPHAAGGVAAYIRRCRLQAAAELTKSSDLPIDEIAARVGFDDYNYFLRVFKKVYGSSPKKLRLQESGVDYAKRTTRN